MSDAHIESASCSESSSASGEPLAGSASDAPLFAALAWPKARWHHDKAALSEGLPPAVGALEKTARELGQKLQLRLFERPGAAAADGVELLCADFANGRSLALRAPDAAAAARAIERFVQGESAGPALTSPLVLVCTDGRHDRCCGKLGRSLVQALRGSVDVAEASHLGGHRLAANCLVMPSGRLYGRVTAGDVPGLLEAIRHGEVYLPCYRGQTGLGELAQVAEAAALARYPRTRDWLVTAPEIDAPEASVAVSASGVALEVTCARRSYLGLASCGDAEPEERPRWIATRVQPPRGAL
ncbi:MAG TPA: sucrase ferredoxin [Myxococcota bacterium]|nr:sucrase ferredoxin [Myxococcota bacterium]